MTKTERPANAVANRIEISIEQQLAALERQMETERLYLSLAPDALGALRTELAAVERLHPPSLHIIPQEITLGHARALQGVRLYLTCSSILPALLVAMPVSY